MYPILFFKKTDMFLHGLALDHLGYSPYRGLNGEAPLERETFFMLHVYEGISPVEVYIKGQGNLSYWSKPT